MATNYAQSQVSIDDLLEYTSLNGDVSPEEQAAEEEELPHIAPVLPSPLTPEGPATPLPYYLGQHPNASLSAVPKSSLSSQSCHRYMALPLPTPAMLAAAHVPEVSELIPQDHPEWQKLRSGKVTGSSLAEFLGLFEESAGAALSSVGVYKAMRDPAKLKRKVLSLQQEAYTTSEVDAITQVFFDWGHQHEPNGILSYLMAEPQSVVHEVGFVMLDPSLQSLPSEVRQGIDPACLPVIGSSPDGIIVQNAQDPASSAPWRAAAPSARIVLEIKAKTPFRPQGTDLWRWLGRSCAPHNKILPQYFAQAQLNMLVTGANACHLLSHTVRQGSALFNIPLHKQWCNQMLHWVAQLNTKYVVPGLEPPPNVFWDQPEYRQFVALTKEACQGLVGSARQVPSCNGSYTGSGQEPLWQEQPEQQPLHAHGQGTGTDVGVSRQQPAGQEPFRQEPFGRETSETQDRVPPSGLQHIVHHPQQQQPPPQQGLQPQTLWEQDRAEHVSHLATGLTVVPDTQDQQHPNWQVQEEVESRHRTGPPPRSDAQQQQQQQGMSQIQQSQPWQQQQNYHQWQQLYHRSQARQQEGQQGVVQQPAVQEIAASAVLVQPLRHSASLAAAAAVALPEDEAGDTPMPDAEPAAATAPEPLAAAGAQTPAAAAGAGTAAGAEASNTESHGAIGPQGLASCLQSMLHKHRINLMETLDQTCKAALLVLARADVYGLLDRIAQDVKAGWPRNASALCMQRIRGCTPPRPHPQAEGNACDPASKGPAASSPALNNPHGFNPGPNPTSIRPLRSDLGPLPAVASPGLFTSRPAAESPVFNSPASVRPAWIRPAATSPANAGNVPAGTTLALVRPVSNGAGAVSPASARFPSSTSVPAVTHVMPAISPVSPAHDRTPVARPLFSTRSRTGALAQQTAHMMPTSTRHGVSESYQPDFSVHQEPQQRPYTSARVNQGSTAASPAGLRRIQSGTESFSPQQVANLSEAVKKQLYRLVTDHSRYVRPGDFDVYIMQKLADLPEVQALHVLQQLDNVSWVNVQDKTKYIMFFCCHRAQLT